MLMVEGNRMTSRSVISTFIASILLVVFSILYFVSMPAKAISISQGYSTTDKDLQVSMIAALASESSDNKPIVERASENNRGKVVGIVTTIDSSLLTLTNADAKVHVATSGETNTYVTDLNGNIKKGDFIAVSPLKGVGMKASDTDNFLVGVALDDFSSNNAKTEQVQTVDGGSRTVLVNQIKINVAPQDRGQSAAKQKPFLVLFGQSVSGKSVSQTQVIVALIIFLILLIVEGSIIYGAIHSTIISIGRNPLARTALFKQLLQVSWLALVILVFGLGTIYAILWI